jgi:uncharacterized NAD(P)/FAD-binding protein YdhS
MQKHMKEHSKVYKIKMNKELNDEQKNLLTDIKELLKEMEKTDMDFKSAIQLISKYNLKNQ